MTSYKFGDVVLVPFPFTDQSANLVVDLSGRPTVLRPKLLQLASRVFLDEYA